MLHCFLQNDDVKLKISDIYCMFLYSYMLILMKYVIFGLKMYDYVKVKTLENYELVMNLLNMV